MTKTNEYWIWKSEKGKNTCEKCKSLDGKIFYSEDEIPEKPHPNCKCEVVKVSSQTKFEPCSCIYELNQLSKNVQEIIANSKPFLENIYEINTNLEINEEKTEELLKLAYLNKSNFEDEIHKHAKNCPNSVDNVYKEIVNKIIDYEKLKKENNKQAENLYQLKKNIENFDKETKNILIDVEQLKEFSNEKEHSKEECAILNDIEKLKKQYAQIKNEFENYKKQIESLTTKAINIQKAVEAKNSSDALMSNKKLPSLIKIPKTEKLYYVGAAVVDKFGSESETLKLANTNLQNALHHFKYTKNNQNVKKVNSIKEVENSNLEKFMLSDKIPTNSRGVIFNNNAAETRKLWLTNKIQNYVKINAEKLKSNKNPILEILEFSSSVDLDAYLALQHCKMYNPHITKDGYFEAIIYDYYDFEHREPDPNAKGIIDKKFNSLATEVNNWGHRMQERKLLENYFVIYKIREKIW